MHDTERLTRIQSIHQMRPDADTATRADLRRVLADDADAWVRAAAASALGRMRDLDSVPGLIAACADSRRRVRDAAVNAVARIGSVDALPALIDRLHDEHTLIRRSAVAALAALGDPRALSALRDLQADPALAEELRTDIGAAIARLDCHHTARN